MAKTAAKPKASTPKKKSTAKPKATAKPGVKGRTSAALANRHRWTPDELARLVKGADKAKDKSAFFTQFANKLGNGIQPASVRAQYYAAKRGAVTGVRGGGTGTVALGKAGKLPTDPIQRVKAMVQRKGLVQRTVASAEAKLSGIDAKIEALVAQKASLTETVEQGNAEVADLNGKLAAITG